MWCHHPTNGGPFFVYENNTKLLIISNREDEIRHLKSEMDLWQSYVINTANTL